MIEPSTLKPLSKLRKRAGLLLHSLAKQAGKLYARNPGCRGSLNPKKITFVLFKGHRGWILDALCREIAAFIEGDISFHYGAGFVPESDYYFFATYSVFLYSLRYNPRLYSKPCIVWYPHEKDIGMHLGEISDGLHHAEAIFCQNSEMIQRLRNKGFTNVCTSPVVGGANPDFFSPHKRANGKVGFSAQYYPRKGADRMLELVCRLPHRSFLLVGRNWSQYTRFNEMKNLPNFEYVEACYEDYPKYYSQMDVFVSTSYVEGGPVPILEAMLSNCVPVASRTGFATDLIRHGINGYIFGQDQSMEEVTQMIEEAFCLEGNIRENAMKYSWAAMAHTITSNSALRLKEQNLR